MIFCTQYGSSIKFQFTPLREGRLSAALEFVHVVEFQFTPLREGRPPNFQLEGG